MEHDRSPSGSSTKSREFLDSLENAAIEAELATGKREETIEEARRNVLVRIARIVAGFVLIGAGLAGLVLPGPGWLLVILGLSLLPYAWAQNMVRLIRRKVPGIPEEGRVPTGSLVVMGAIVVIAVALSLLFGNDLTEWIRGLGNPDALLS